jgi:hypothetical protein
VGLALEPGLSLRMAEDTGSGDALPLLAFTLRELWEAHGGDGELSLREYESLGGLEKAVERAANEVMHAHRLSEGERRALRQAFIPAMVRLNEQGTFTRRSARWDTLPAAAKPLLAELANRRLLVQRGEGGERSVEVTHEALLRQWPLLKQWLEEERGFLKAYEQIKRDHSQWKEAPAQERADLLLQEGKLKNAVKTLKDHPHAFAGELGLYIEASVHRERALNRKRRIYGLGILMLFLVTLYCLLMVIPRLRARILVPLASVTNNKALIQYALGALLEHRKQLLKAAGNEQSRPGGSVFQLHCTDKSTEPFCVSERQTTELLEIGNAPYSLPKVRYLLGKKD